MKKAQSLFALALTIVLLVKVGLSQAPEGSSFCTNLDSIVRAGNDDFRSLLGARDPDGDGQIWSSKISLQGAQECGVYGPASLRSVSCDYQESTSESDLEERYAALVKNLGDCLPKWSKTETKPEKDLVKETRFLHRPITVRVGITKKASSRHPGYNLEVWIDNDTGD